MKAVYHLHSNCTAFMQRECDIYRQLPVSSTWTVPPCCGILCLVHANSVSTVPGYM